MKNWLAPLSVVGLTTFSSATYTVPPSKLPGRLIDMAGTPPRGANVYDDVGIQVICNAAWDFIKRGHLVYLKWTCPSCGERSTADDPLEIVAAPTADDPHREGIKLHAHYQHTQKADGSPCMISVSIKDTLFNCMLVIDTDVEGLNP